MAQPGDQLISGGSGAPSKLQDWKLTAALKGARVRAKGKWGSGRLWKYLRDYACIWRMCYNERLPP